MTKIEIRKNGPFVVHGEVELVSSNGEVLETTDRTFLCRCGSSRKQPYCDGAHKQVAKHEEGL